jgi:hypothetical protein
MQVSWLILLILFIASYNEYLHVFILAFCLELHIQRVKVFYQYGDVVLFLKDYLDCAVPVLVIPYCEVVLILFTVFCVP